MAIPAEVISEIKYKNEIAEIISPYVNLKRRGRNLVGLCPFHNEKTPSFTVYPENGSFYCFGCGVGGDIFTFTSMIENLDYIESVKLLAERSGVDIPESGYDNSMSRLKTTILEINRETARFYHKYLFTAGGKWALDYLTGRGLTLQTIKHFGLGCAPDSWDELINHLKSKGYSLSDMFQANVVSKNSRGGYFDRFRNRVVFPIINLRGNVIAFSARANPSDTKAAGKYVNTSDTPVYKKSENLYGFNFAKNHCSERIILVEGNMDVISLHQAGFENTVAALGTAFTIEQAKLLSRYTKEIVITLDADAAGQKAVKRALETLKDSGMPIRVLVIPDGKDPDDFIKKNSPEKFKALLEGAVTDIEYKLYMESAGIDFTKNDGGLLYLKKAAAVLAETSDSLTVDLYAGKLSERFGVSKQTILNTVKEIKNKNAKQEFKKEIANVINPKYSANDINPQKRFLKRACVAEEAIISVLLNHPDTLTFANEKLKKENFLTDLNRKVFELINTLAKQSEEIDVSHLGQYLTSAEIGYVVSLLNSNTAKENAHKVLKDSIEILLYECLLHKNEAEGETDDDWVNQLQSIVDNKKGV